MSDLFIQFAPEALDRYYLFVHGGPGGHCHVFLDYYAASEAYRNSGVGIVFYDQRGCGKSPDGNLGISHEQNVMDLKSIVDACIAKYKDRFQGIIGHSYGGRLLFDFYQDYQSEDLRHIFVGRSLLPATGATNNLLINAWILKALHPDRYETFYQQMALETEFRMDQVLKSRTMVDSQEARQALRENFVWANPKALEWYRSWQKRSTVSDRDDTMEKILQSSQGSKGQYARPCDLAGAPKNSDFVIGFWDVMMSGAQHISIADPRVQVMMGSSHYPHIEQADRFLEILLK